MPCYWCQWILLLLDLLVFVVLGLGLGWSADEAHSKARGGGHGGPEAGQDRRLLRHPSATTDPLPLVLSLLLKLRFDLLEARSTSPLFVYVLCN